MPAQPELFHWFSAALGALITLAIGVALVVWIVREARRPAILPEGDARSARDASPPP